MAATCQCLCPKPSETQARFQERHLSSMLQAMQQKLEDGTAVKCVDYYLQWFTLNRFQTGDKMDISCEEFATWLTDIESSGLSSELVGRPNNDLDNLPVAPYEDPEYVKACGEGCEVCLPQFFPALFVISDDNAMKDSYSTACYIIGDFDYLKSTLEIYADALVTRWNKWSRQKRREFLDSLPGTGDENGGVYPKHPAIPNLCNAHKIYPNGYSFIKMARDLTGEEKSREQAALLEPGVCSRVRPTEAAENRGRYWTSWLLPYMDTQTLSDSPLTMLSLLHCRAKYTPSEWALFDCMNVAGAEKAKIIPSEFNSQCLNFQPDDYGGLILWDRSLAHSQSIIGYTKGFYILTAQRRMYQFLRSFVDGLLAEVRQRSHAVHGVLDFREQADHLRPPPDSGDAANAPKPQIKWERLVENGFSSFGPQPVVSLSSYTNQHLVAPPHADPRELHRKIQAAYQNALDDLWAIQTEPQEIQMQVKEFCSCLYFHYLDKEKEWSLICDAVILLPVRRELWWRQTLKQADHLVQAHEAMEKDPSEDSILRRDSAMLVLWDCCTEQINHAILEMKADLPYQRGFERNYKWEASSSGKRRRPKIFAKDWFLEDILFWCLDCFCGDRFREFACDPVTYLQVFDRHLREANETERRRISPIMMRRVSEIAAIDEIRTAIKCTRGINRKASREFEDKFTDEWTKRKQSSSVFNMVKNNLYEQRDIPDAACESLKKLCTQCPWPKVKPDALTLKRTAGARDALADMWRQIRTEFRKLARPANIGNEVVVEYLQKWSLDQSEEYQDLRRDEAVEIQRALDAPVIPKRAAKATHDASKFGKHQHTLGDAPESRNLKNDVLRDLSANKPKTKTHGTATVTAPTPAPETTPDVDPTPRVAVKKSSLPLLEHMFPLAELATESGKNWKWQNFVSVMLDAGCRITQGSGSAVSFEHPSGVGRIVFHQPHPQPVMNPIMLRSWGRRLQRSFGWGRDVFVVRE